MDTAVDSIKAQVPNRYSLVVLAAKRAKQIKEGSPLLIQTDNPNALSVALDEIAAGKIGYIEAVEPEDDEAPVVPTPAPAPVAKAESEAMQMLTQSLAEAERAAMSGEADANPSSDEEDQSAETSTDAEGSEEE